VQSIVIRIFNLHAGA
jgi:hypothetical protein